MKCSQIRKKLSAFIDNEASEQEKRLIAEHLKSCERCRKELQELAQVSDVLNLMDEVRVSPFFITRLKQRIAAEKSRYALRLPFVEWIRRATVPAFATALVIFSFVLGNYVGKAMYRGTTQDITRSETEIVEALGVATLDDFPKGSLGWAYNNLLTGGE